MFQGRKIIVFLVSLLGAVLLWLYVVTTIAPETTGTVGNIPVTVEDKGILSENNLIITGQSTKTIDLEIRTSRVNMSKLNASTVRIIANASNVDGAGVKELSYTIIFPDTVNANDITILRKSRDTVKIEVSTLARKTIPIVPNPSWEKAVKDGYVLEKEDTEIVPNEVEITGPEYEVNQITQAILRYEIDSLDKTKFELAVPFDLCDADGNPVPTELTEPRFDSVELTIPIKRTRTLQLALNLIPGAGVTEEYATVELKPSSILVKGSTADIEKLGDVFTIGELDLASFQDRKEYTVSLSLPEGISSMDGVTRVDAVVIVTGISRKQFSVSDVRFVNAPEGYAAKLSGNKIDITVQGPIGDVNKLTANSKGEIYIEVDLEGATEAGTFIRPATVVIPKYPALGIIETDLEVTVDLLEDTSAHDARPE